MRRCPLCDCCLIHLGERLACPTLGINLASKENSSHYECDVDGQFLLIRVSDFILRYDNPASDHSASRTLTDQFSLWKYSEDDLCYTWLCNLPLFEISSEDKLLHKMKVIAVFS